MLLNTTKWAGTSCSKNTHLSVWCRVQRCVLKFYIWDSGRSPDVSCTSILCFQNNVLLWPASFAWEGMHSWGISSTSYLQCQPRDSLIVTTGRNSLLMSSLYILVSVYKQLLLWGLVLFSTQTVLSDSSLWPSFWPSLSASPARILPVTGSSWLPIFVCL